MLVENPILNSPYEEPQRYWAYEERQPVIKPGRRPAGYYFRTSTQPGQVALFEEEFVPLTLVNELRKRVEVWREKDYPGITPITRQLLSYWNGPERERQLFFCQKEAIETLIWLVEASQAEKEGISIPKHGLSLVMHSKWRRARGKLLSWQCLLPGKGSISASILGSALL
ncbi:MAG: hypothetical protein NZ580_03995 [Bacteroidia bacterium]|nr:hypothetical protein [Bacteroidia bacterium]MDW8236250.1 hypothetical protein [Bacteroidia bacterium]